MIRTVQCLMYEENGKKSVKMVPVKIGSGFSDMHKSLVSGAVLSGKTEAGLQKIEVFLDSDYVDVSSESAYARIKDTLKLMQRIKITNIAVGSADAENLAPKPNNNVTRSRAKTPTAAPARTAFGVNKAGNSAPQAAAPRAAAVAPMRARHPAAASLCIATPPVVETSEVAAMPSPPSGDRFKTSPTFTVVSTSPRGSARSSLDGETKCAGINLADEPTVSRSAPAVKLVQGDTHLESLLLCPGITRANTGLTRANTGLTRANTGGAGVPRTYSGFPLESLDIPLVEEPSVIKACLNSLNSHDTDDEDDDLVVLDDMDLWNGIGMGPVPQPLAPASEEDLVLCGEAHDASILCGTPKCMFHLLTPEMTPRRMSSVASSKASSLCPSLAATRTASPVPPLSRESSHDTMGANSSASAPSPARGQSSSRDGSSSATRAVPFSSRIMSSTASTSSKKAVSGEEFVAAACAAAAPPVAANLSRKRPSSSTGGSHVRAPSPNPSNTTPGHIKCASPSRGRQTVLTAGELNSRFMNNIRQCDYNAVVTGGSNRAPSPAPAAAPATSANFKQPSPSRARVQASPTRIVRSGTTMVATGGGPTVKYDQRIPGSGITRGSVTPTRSNSAGRCAASPSTNGKGTGSSRAAAPAAGDRDEISDEPVFPATPATGKKRSKKAAAAGDGDARGEEGERLSINTLIRQCDILKKITGLSEEDIEWTAVKDNAGAYKHAAAKQAKAEDNYFRSVYDMELYSAIKKCINMSGSCRLYTLMQSIVASSEVFYINPTDAAAVEKVTKEKAELIDLLTAPQSPIMASTLNCQTNFANPTVMSDKLHKLIMDAVEGAKECKDVSRKIKLVVQTHYPQECKEVVDRFARSETLNNDSCQEMEKWEKRKTSTKEYASVQREEEARWLAVEEEANCVALQTMRSLMTPMMLGNAAAGIGSLTLAELNTLVLENEGVFSHELMVELKANKCLHWCIKHIDDIANASFLSGESKAFFESLESFDIIECRALVHALKGLTKFNNDNDGKKMEWRDRLFAKCKSMIDQFNGMEVKGSWSAKEGKRSMVKLPPLKPDQLRRPVYFHKTHAQFLTKLKQYDDKLALLAKKEGFMAAAKTAFEDAVSEWNTLLAELRDDKLADLLTTCTKEQIADLKKEASAGKLMTEKKYKMLQLEVANLRRTIETNPVSREQFVRAKEQLEAFLLRQESVDGAAPTPYSEITTPSNLRVVGVFDRDPLIEKSEMGSGAKFLSPEEEAAQRLAEIQGLKVGSQDQDIVPESVAAAECTRTPGKISRAFVDALEKTPGAGGAKTPVRRGSILDSFNPAHLNSISKSIMKTQAGGPDAESQPMALSLSPVPMRSDKGGSSTEASAADTKPTAPAAAPKDLQSKLLKRMMGVKDKNAPEVPAAALSPMRLFGGATGGGGMSFLDQIKMGKSQANSPVPGGGGSNSQLSFLDQIKQGAGGRTPPPVPSSNSPMSFLDEIKAKRMKE